jgi:hypothetical protein
VLEIRLLGTPEFAYDGRPFRFAGLPRAIPLLAWCLMNRRSPLPRDGIAFAFWPDVDEEEARANLRRHLYSIAKALPDRESDPWILADKKTVAWNSAAPLRFDVTELERLAADENTLDEAAALYRGPFLDGYDEPWIEPERERRSARSLTRGGCSQSIHGARTPSARSSRCGIVWATGQGRYANTARSRNGCVRNWTSRRCWRRPRFTTRSLTRKRRFAP